MIGSILAQNSKAFGELNDNWVVIPVEYDDVTEKIVTINSDKLKAFRREFSNFKSALEYSKQIRTNK